MGRRRDEPPRLASPLGVRSSGQEERSQRRHRPENDRMDSSTDTRLRILRAARDLFSYFGFRKTSMDDVANRAEVAKGTIYHYFKNKNEVLKLVLRQEVDQLRDQLQLVLEDTQGPRSKLRLFLTRRVSDFGSIHLLIGHLVGDSQDRRKDVDEERQRLDEMERRTLETILDEGVRTGDFEIPSIPMAALSLLAITKGFIRDGLELEQELETFIDIALRGFSRPPHASS